jgi:hypothetical protein
MGKVNKKSDTVSQWGILFNIISQIQIVQSRSGETAFVPRSGVTLYQGTPGSKHSKAPLVEVLKARVEHRICTSFLGGPGHVHPESFWIYTLWNAISSTLGRDFTEFWWSENDIVTYQRPWPMFLLYRLHLGAPIWPIEVGGPQVLPVWAHSSYATGTTWQCDFYGISLKFTISQCSVRFQGQGILSGIYPIVQVSHGTNIMRS